jgi:putative ATPase
MEGDCDMDLFDYARKKEQSSDTPLAYRMRPRTLDEFAGQEHLIAPGRLLYQALENDRLPSAIFYGPPGTGKTSLAGIMANTTKAQFIPLDATSTGVTELRKVIQEARDRLKFYDQKTLLFIDEIHRFNKAQQDVLLPPVEQGVVVLIGATTENPYFSVNAPLLSRTRVLPFYPLDEDDQRRLLERALHDEERGLGKMKVELAPDAVAHWLRISGGDGRALLNALEFAVKMAKPEAEGKIVISEQAAAEAVQQRLLLYDRSGDAHYDVVSAFIKSMRGSDPDAALHWLARMLKAGEDHRFIARRIVICAAEDVGLADPNALVVATAMAQGLEYVGMPEGQLLLSEATVYVACAPKSNSCTVAIGKAKEDLDHIDVGTVPKHLRDSHYKGAKNFGHGDDYQYPHNFPGHYVPQQYLPDVLQGKRYYEPSDSGREKTIKERLAFLREHFHRS